MKRLDKPVHTDAASLSNVSLPSGSGIIESQRWLHCRSRGVQSCGYIVAMETANSRSTQILSSLARAWLSHASPAPHDGTAIFHYPLTPLKLTLPYHLRYQNAKKTPDTSGPCFVRILLTPERLPMQLHDASKESISTDAAHASFTPL